ncbi:MAG: DinB family protein [Acidobacteria bacterium]|nr:DinB family protein [Acidobacteriota bacterium]
MGPEERAVLIEKYKEGYKQVIDALKGVSVEELDFRRAPGKWTAREIVHHLADSESQSAIRLRRLLAEHQHYIQGYDQDEFTKRLHYSKRPIEPALAAFEAARATTAQLFEFMTEEDWKRTGEHSDSGPYSVETWLGIYAVHAHNHADQIRQNRSAFKEKQ